jgi:hypothetical protein
MRVPSTEWISKTRRCSCSMANWGWPPEIDCDIHGVDAYYGRYDNPWWGRITIPRSHGRTVQRTSSRPS